MKKIYSLLIILLLFLSGCKPNEKPPINEEKPTFPSQEQVLLDNQQDETIYIKLNKAGEVESMKSVIHISNVLKDRYLTYKGTFLTDGHANLSNELDLDVSNTTLKAPVLDNNDHYYFEVSLNKNNYELPFTFEFLYKLDGNVLSYENISNKEGKVEIELKVTSNYQSPYVAQIQIPLNIEQHKITSFKGASASMLVGKTQTLVYMVMPSKSETFTIELDSKNFTLENVQIALQTFDMLNALPIDLESFNNIELLPSSVGVIKTGILELQNIDTLINTLHPALLSGFDNVASMTEFSQFSTMFNETVINDLLKPAQYATTPETQIILPHVSNLQSKFLALQEINNKLNTYLAIHLPKIESYKQRINNYSDAYEHVAKLLEEIEKIEQTVTLMASASSDLENIIKNKDQMIQALTLLDEQITAFKQSNLTLIKSFQLYEHTMTKDILTIIEMLDITIELGSLLSSLNDEFIQYSSSLKQALINVTDPEGIQAFQTAIAYLDGIEGSQENPGLINVLTQALTQFNIPELTQNKMMLSMLLDENELQIPTLAAPLYAFIELDQGLSLRQPGEAMSFYEGMYQLIGSREYISLLPDDTEIKSFLDETNPIPKSVQFVIVY